MQENHTESKKNNNHNMQSCLPVAKITGNPKKCIIKEYIRISKCSGYSSILTISVSITQARC